MCDRKCLRPSKMMDLLGLIFGHIGEGKFHWDELKTEIPEIPRHPPISLIDAGMLISEGRDESYGRGTHQIWTISKDVTYWLQNPEPERNRRRNN